jgi:hypothetical protein
VTLLSTDDVALTMTMTTTTTTMWLLDVIQQRILSYDTNKSDRRSWSTYDAPITISSTAPSGAVVVVVVVVVVLDCEASVCELEVEAGVVPPTIRPLFRKLTRSKSAKALAS